MHNIGKSIWGGALVMSLAAGLVTSVPDRAEANTFQSISFLTGGDNAAGSGKPETTDMSFLATRSQRKDLTRAGVGPFTMTHTNADPSLSYAFETDAKYGDNVSRHSSCSSDPTSDRACDAQLRESDLRAASSMQFSITSNNGTTAVLNNRGNIQQVPTGGTGSNLKDGFVTFGSIFGPDVFSAPFAASASAAVSVEWTAADDGDDYEIYGFLVEVDVSSGECVAGNTANVNFGGTTQAEKLSSHEILIYGRGKYSKNAAGGNINYTQKGVIANDGCYRFRLVNGTYDASGGFAVGAQFTVTNLRVGQNQIITATPQPDIVIDSSSARSLQIDATSNAGSAATAAITYTTITSQNGVCSVNSSGVITVAQNKTGFCSIAMNSAAIGSYSAAETTFLTFTVLASAVAPVYSGGAAVSGQATICSALTAVDGSWSDGGQPITATAYQWTRDGSNIAGATSANYTIQDADLGKAIGFVITRTNSVGSTSANSNAVVVVDARLVGLSLSVTTGLSPTFTGCTTSYTTTTVDDSVTVTATMNAAADSIAVSGSAVVSAQTSSPIALLPGANVIPIVVTAGAFTLTYNITVTYAAPPTVQALAPTFTDGTQATLSATVDANGFNTSNITFTITPTGGTSGTPVQGTLTPSQVTGDGATTVEQDVTGLVIGGFYTFQVSVTNANGTSTDSISFQTPDAPSVLNGAASNVTGNSASVSYEINTFIRTTTVTFSFSVNSDLSSPTEVAVGNLTAAGSATTGTVDLTGLVPGTTYYYNFSAQNSAGSNVGAIRSFTTFGAPIVAVVAGEGGERTALLKATVNAAGLTTSTVRFYYSTTTNFASSISVVATPANVSGGTDTNVQARISNLNSGTYYYKAEAVNSAGTTLSSTFETVVVTDELPTVTLAAATTVATGGAITVTVRFSETVTGFASTDLTFTPATGYTRQAAQDLGGGVFSVTLTTTGTETGTMTIGLAANVVTEATGAARGNLAATSITVIVGATPPDVSYTSNALTLTVGQAMTTLTPANSGGASTSWSPSIALPAGLVIDNSTGVISGTPVAIQSATAYVITVENSGGTDTFTITITIVYQVPGISFQSTEYTLVVGNPFSETPANSGGPIFTWTIVGSLPEGLTFNTSTGAISGTPSAPAERLSITISGENGTGVSSATIGIRVLAFVHWNGPHVQLVVPTVLITSGGETVTLHGLRLNRIESLEIDGIVVTITVTSNKQVSFVTPSMSPGVKTLRLHGSQVGKHHVVSALLVVEPAQVQVPVTTSPEVPTASPEVPTTSPEVPTTSPEVPTTSPEVPTTSPEVDGGDESSDPVLTLEKRVLSGFAPGSSVLTQAMKDRLAVLVSELGTVIAFSCVGFTQGPSVLAVDLALSLARAQVVCDELRLLLPDAEVRQIVGRQDNPVGAPIRRTEIFFIIETQP